VCFDARLGKVAATGFATTTTIGSGQDVLYFIDTRVFNDLKSLCHHIEYKGGNCTDDGK
jgi:hypothetical protein